MGVGVAVGSRLSSVRKQLWQRYLSQSAKAAEEDRDLPDRLKRHQSRQAQGTALQAGLGQGGTLLKVSGGKSPRRRQDVAANQLTTSYRISHIGQGCVETDEQADMTPALEGPAIQQMARVSCELPGRSAGTLQA